MPLSHRIARFQIEGLADAVERLVRQDEVVTVALWISLNPAPYQCRVPTGRPGRRQNVQPASGPTHERSRSDPWQARGEPLDRGFQADTAKIRKRSLMGEFPRDMRPLSRGL